VSRNGQFDASRGGMMISPNRVLPQIVRKPPEISRFQAVLWQGQKDSNSRHAVLEWLLKRARRALFGHLLRFPLRFDALLMLSQSQKPTMQ